MNLLADGHASMDHNGRGVLGRRRGESDGELGKCHVMREDDLDPPFSLIDEEADREVEYSTRGEETGANQVVTSSPSMPHSLTFRPNWAIRNDQGTACVNRRAKFIVRDLIGARRGNRLAAARTIA